MRLARAYPTLAGAALALALVAGHSRGQEPSAPLAATPPPTEAVSAPTGLLASLFDDFDGFQGHPDTHGSGEWYYVSNVSPAGWAGNGTSVPLGFLPNNTYENLVGTEFMHPAASIKGARPYTCVQWLSGYSGVVRVKASWTYIGGHKDQDGASCHVIKTLGGSGGNPKTLFQDNVLNSGDTTSVELEVFVAAGNSIVFSEGPIGNNFADACTVAFTVEVADPPSPPTADAGADFSVVAGDVATLDGSGSFDQETASEDLEYSWSLVSVPAGSAAVLSGALTAFPSFVADRPGTFVASLVVTDEDGLDSTDQVQVTSLNAAPVADAGADQGGVVGFPVSLDGGGSADPDGHAISYSWSLQGPAGSGALLSGAATAQPGFVPDVAGTYVATLVVHDGFVGSAPDAVAVDVLTAEEYAAQESAAARDVVAGLPMSHVTTKGNQNALQNFLDQAIVALGIGDLEEARHKLEQAIARTDGCPLRGAPDGNGPGRDWIVDCGSQAIVYDRLTEALAAIAP